MKKKNSCSRIIKSIALSLAVIIISIPSMNVHAAQPYKLTLKAGELGTFKNLGSLDPSIAALSSDNKTITITGEKVDLANLITYYSDSTGQGVLQLDLANYMEPASLEYKKNTGSGDTLTRNETIVIQYGDLIDGVEYKICYVDAATGYEIASPVISRATDNTSVTAKARTDIPDYQLASANEYTWTLNSADANTLTYSFLYNYTGLGGGTTVIDEGTNTTLITTDGGTETVYQVNEVPTYVSTPVAGGGGQGAGGGAQAADEGGANVQIGDGNVPLAPSIEEDTKKGLENTDKDVILEDEEVPKGLFGTGVNPTSAIIASGIGLAILAGILFGASRFKKSRVAAVSDQEGNTTEK